MSSELADERRLLTLEMTNSNIPSLACELAYSLIYNRQDPKKTSQCKLRLKATHNWLFAVWFRCCSQKCHKGPTIKTIATCTRCKWNTTASGKMLFTLQIYYKSPLNTFTIAASTLTSRLKNPPVTCSWPTLTPDFKTMCDWNDTACWERTCS